MAFSHSPKIVTDGLVLCLDAANPKSYPGTGTTWSDLSGNGNNGTLENGVGYNSGNGGSLTFDGSNDYFEVSSRNTALEFQPLQPYSVFCWVYNLVFDGGAILSNMVGTSPYQGWDLWMENSTSIAAHLISSWSGNAVKVGVDFDYTSNANKWVYIGYTYNGTSPVNATNALNSIDFYVNGQLTTSGKSNLSGADGFDSTSETTSYNASQRFRIASRWASSSFSQGSLLTISICSIYNRALTASEVLQNYNATKGRFGL